MQTAFFAVGRVRFGCAELMVRLGMVYVYNMYYDGIMRESTASSRIRLASSPMRTIGFAPCQVTSALHSNLFSMRCPMQPFMWGLTGA
jgi:hypothetical protein